MLPSVVPRLSTDLAVRVFPGVWKLLSFLRLPSRGWSSISTSFVSLFVFYIFSYLLLKTMGCFSGCLMSSAGIQKLFCGIYSVFKCSFDEFVGEKVVSPSYSSTIFYHSFLIHSSKTAFRMGENNSKWSNWQTTNLKNIKAIPTAQFQKNKSILYICVSFAVSHIGSSLSSF